MTKWWWRPCIGLAGGVLGSAGVGATEVPLDERIYVETRYRYSNLHSDGKPRRGHANTLRARLGYHFDFGSGWTAYAEGLRTWSLFGSQYDDGSGWRTPYPAEPDPASTNLSNAWVGYRDDAVSFRVGRQFVRLDNGRFFSNNPWRQNLQSFDGVSASWKAWKGGELGYHWLGRVNRTLGADFHDRDQRRWKLDAHLLHADQALPVGKLTAYGYFVRNDTSSVNSVRTAGARWTGKQAVGPAGTTLGWTAEWARQHDYANNPGRFSLGYHLLEASYGIAPIAVRVGDERLDGDGRHAFNVAYGAARAFNGWVVAFRIPKDGLQERYAGLYGTVEAGRKLTWQVTYRHFEPVRGAAAAMLGNELDAGVQVNVAKGLSLEMQYGDYRASSHGVDERKLWLIAEYRFGRAPD
ncbi:alginate export family protein [Bacillus sp. NP157]|nr:alginate export family protein [Bacillus sp. NP157]